MSARPAGTSQSLSAAVSASTPVIQEAATLPAKPLLGELPALDVLRGIAALLMIASHVGVALAASADSPTTLAGFITFIGSFAPVLFFFSTGYGIGLRSRTPWTGNEFVELLLKVALLLIADQFFAWQHSAWLGIDFFAFIAIITLVMLMLSKLRNASQACLLLAAGLLVLRFAAGPRLQAIEPHSPLFTWIVGFEGMKHVSYPLSPWLVYPLVGFFMARWKVSSQSRNGQLCASGVFVLGIALLVAATCIAMSRANMVFFRWGSVSFAYFVTSIGILAMAILIADKLIQLPRWIYTRISLRGVGSFAVIPIHYLLLWLYTNFSIERLELISFLTVLILFSITSLAAAAAYGIFCGHIGSKFNNIHYVSWIIVLITVFLCIPRGQTFLRIPLEILTFTGQMSIAMLLTRSKSTRRGWVNQKSAIS